MKTAVISIGNPLKGDDDIGNLLVKRLSKEIKNKDYVFTQAGTVPENFLISIQKEKPEIIYFIDAVDFKGEVGDVKVFSFDKIINLNLITTHNIPITLFKKFLPDAKIKLIGIKVKRTDFNNGLSDEIKDNYDKILKKVKNIIML